ncbi:hypothetical protein Nepgr_025742 [Nepenthes gracilis]|uniref:Uncharacterized protein n=1 Tax=Nepenthes gracilis TaxID=150966 RepID=A0AAD3T7H5_NEPGR|nr:hypothetical protein Nepgr_025742 [Nepenthes gracilis]
MWVIRSLGKTVWPREVDFSKRKAAGNGKANAWINYCPSMSMILLVVEAAVVGLVVESSVCKMLAFTKGNFQAAN